MKKFFLLTLLAALTACSGHTLIVADVDLLSLAGDTAGLSGDLAVTGSAQVYVPDSDNNLATPDGGYLVGGLPTLDDLYGFGVELTVAVENTGAGPLTFSADFRLASAADSTNIYDGSGDVSLASKTITLDPGESGQVELAATLERGDANLALISDQGFRVGVSLAASGTTTVHYQLTAFRVIAEQRPFDLIPPP